MSKSVNVDFVTRQIEVDTDGKEHFISAAMAAKDAEQSMLNAQNAATSVQKYKALWFDSVAAMKAEPSLTAGAYVCTAGYYEPNDGGGASYLIRAKTDTDVDDGGSLHELANGLVAALVSCGNSVCPSQFGARHNLVNDDSAAIQKCLDLLHKKKFSILDLQGYKYLVNKCLKIDSMYKCIIKNGQLISNNFAIDGVDSTNNYIIKTTNNYGEESGQQGSFGYALEDVIFEKLTIDCGLQDGVGCLYFNTFFRVQVLKCDFRRFKTYGINMSDDAFSDGHELVIDNCFFRSHFKDENNESGTAIRLTRPDLILSNLVIVGGTCGILLEASSSNLLSNIHLYGCEVCIQSNEAHFNNYINIYFDGGVGLVLDEAWYTTFSNCYWLNCYPPIKFLHTNTSQMYVVGLNFQGCIARGIQQDNISELMENIDLITLADNNYIDIACHTVHNNSTIINTNFTPPRGNYIFFNNNTNMYYMDHDGLSIYPSLNIKNNYTFEICGEVINITNYNTNGWTWLGIPIQLPQNTDMVISNKLANLAFKIVGFNSINEGDTGVQLAYLEKASTVKKKVFNTGDYSYYILSIYDKGFDSFVCNKVNSVTG